jgi:hypothetical protein
MGVSKGIDAKPRHEIEILFALDIVEEDALSALHDEGIPAVCLQEKLAFALDDFFGVGHGDVAILSEP